MFYKSDQPHGLPRNPFKSLVVPRPIGWISTVSKDGVVNLAPFSFFNGCSDSPPIVCFSCNGTHSEGGFKDTLNNVQETGEFVVNIATWDLRREMNETSAMSPRSVDEMVAAGLPAAASELVKPPRVAQAPAHLECTYLKTVELPSTLEGSFNNTVFGLVVGIHIDESILTDGWVDMDKFRPIARLGYMDYCVVDNHFTMMRPE
jgi:flavin reductase (DIM6/NTAB) family NADH-FMN oxidoreductase RutF